MVRASIVVLCYNGLEETTRPCLESIVANTPADGYELIVVDNASADGTAAYLKVFASQHTNIKLQLNGTNKGYAGGNNDGLRLAQGQYIILLNNDTLVPRGWLERLLRLFEAQPDIGLVGPITNSAGNEQRIGLVGLNEKNYEEIAGAYIERHQGVWFKTEKLGFFCVAMRREVPDKIGILDERFGIGMFEDDDYCIRAKKAGYQIAVVEDCFVYHKGSVSFKKMSDVGYRNLFEKNKSIFREKHKIEWTFTDIAFLYLEKLMLDLREQTKDGLLNSQRIERIVVRQIHFKELLLQIREIEIANVPIDIRGAPINPAVHKSKWKFRWGHFKRSFILGSRFERSRYIENGFKKAARRMGFGMTRLEHTFDDQTPEGQILGSLEKIQNTLKGRKLIVFPATLDFHYMTQRPQHLARAFSRAGYVVIYGTLNQKVDRVGISEKITDDLYLLNENCFPFISQIFNRNQVIYYCLWPNNIKHFEHLTFSYLLYDYMDELSLLDLPENLVMRDHKKIIECADLVTVSADNLLKKLPEYVLKKTLLINNAVSTDFIETVDAADDYKSMRKELNEGPVLGYFGAIAEWIDFDLVDRLAADLSSSRIILIGPVSEGVSKRVSDTLCKHRNVTILPPCGHLELVQFLKCFDVCLIPFVKNEITDAVSPVKLFEYFSAGKPIVATDIVECAKYPLVKIARTHDQFINAVTDSLFASCESSKEEFRNLALVNTWQCRIEQITGFMSASQSNYKRS